MMKWGDSSLQQFSLPQGLDKLLSSHC